MCNYKNHESENRGYQPISNNGQFGYQPQERDGDNQRGYQPVSSQNTKPSPAPAGSEGDDA